MSGFVTWGSARGGRRSLLQPKFRNLGRSVGFDIALTVAVTDPPDKAFRMELATYPMLVSNQDGERGA
jgi:hypothetical protein